MHSSQINQTKPISNISKIKQNKKKIINLCMIHPRIRSSLGTVLQIQTQANGDTIGSDKSYKIIISINL